MNQQQQHFLPTSHLHNMTISYPKEKFEFSNQSMVYPGSTLYVSPMINTQSLPPDASYYYDQHHQLTMPYSQRSRASNSSSPESVSIMCPSNMHVSSSTVVIQEPPMLVTSSSSTTTASSSSVEYLNEAFAKASAIPESFYPEFLQYSKETYEQQKPSRKKLKRCKHQLDEEDEEETVESSKNHISDSPMKNGEPQDDDDQANNNEESLTSTEIRRQIHIQSEQKRRAQIKDGFEELRNELPTCLNKKMSKVALLHRTVQHIQHLKETQASILAELEKLVHENEQLRKFQESVLEKQALESIYTMTNM